MCKDVGSIYHIIYVALVRTCIYVYFVHLLFNSDLPSIYLIRSGDGRISYSILPRWDFFVHRHKERKNTTHCDWNEFRECAATSHAFQFGSALLWATAIWISVRQCAAMSHCDLNIEMTGLAGLFGMFTKNTALCAFATALRIRHFALACLHFRATVLRERHVASLHALAFARVLTEGLLAFCMH